MIVDGEAVAVLPMHVERDSCCIKLGLVRAYRAARHVNRENRIVRKSLQLVRQFAPSQVRPTWITQ